MKVGRAVSIGESVGMVEGIDAEGYRLIRFDREVDEEKYGRLALPHYMNRESVLRTRTLPDGIRQE